MAAASSVSAPESAVDSLEDVVRRCPVLGRLRYPCLASHRGGAATFGPENTLYNYSKCVHEIGTDVLEVDVRRCRDGHLVIMHDASVDRTTNGSGSVANLTLAHIKSLDAAYRFTPDGGRTYPLRGKGITVPTLREVLEEFSKVDSLVFFFDIKVTGVVADTLQLIAEFGLQQRSILGAVFPAVNREVLALKPSHIPAAPDIKSMLRLYMAYVLGRLHTQTFVRQWELVGWMVPPGHVLHRVRRAGYMMFTPKFVRALHACGRLVAVFGGYLDTAEGQRACLRAGVDIVVTDRPDVLRDTRAAFLAEEGSGGLRAYGPDAAAATSSADDTAHIPPPALGSLPAAIAAPPDADPDLLPSLEDQERAVEALHSAEGQALMAEAGEGEDLRLLLQVVGTDIRSPVLEADMDTVLEQPVVKAALALAVEEMKGNDPSHDMMHVRRVLNTAIRIYLSEKSRLQADPLAVVLGAILHDVGDYKYSGVSRVSEFLTQQGCAPEVIEKVRYVVDNISYSKELRGAVHVTPELAIVQDADRLDAIGAIGIARCFAYGSRKGDPFYSESLPVRTQLSAEEYTSTPPAGSSSINHFHEKLFKLAGMMKTQTGREMAARRHEFMQQFEQQFMAEWEGRV